MKKITKPYKFRKKHEFTDSKFITFNKKISMKHASRCIIIKLRKTKEK